MAGYYYDLHDNTKRNFVHIGIGEEWEFGLSNAGGPTLTTRVDNPGVATLLSDTEVSAGMSKVKFRRAASGNTLVRGIDPDGNEQALTQLVIRKYVAAATIASGPKTGNLISLLDTSRMSPNTNAELILTLKIFLQQNPAGASVTDGAKTFVAQPWSTTAWTRFVRAFKSQGERAWDGKFWLEPPPQYFPLVKDRYQHNVYCRLKLGIVGSAVAAHRTINVIRVVSSKSGQHRSSASVNGGQFDDFDIRWSRYYEGGKTYYQRTIPHELGHMLGIDHIGTMSGVAGCTPANQSQNACYCVSSTDCGDLMGMGHVVSRKDVDPWLERIALHTDTSQSSWTVSMKRVAPWSV